MNSIVNHLTKIYANQPVNLAASTDKELFTAYLNNLGIKWTWLIDTSYNFFQEASQKALQKALQNTHVSTVDVTTMPWSIKAPSDDKAIVREMLNFPAALHQFQKIANLPRGLEYEMDRIWEYIDPADHERVCKAFLSNHPIGQLWSQFSEAELDILIRYLQEPAKWINELSPKMHAFLANQSLEKIIFLAKEPFYTENPKLQNIIKGLSDINREGIINSFAESKEVNKSFIQALQTFSFTQVLCMTQAISMAAIISDNQDHINELTGKKELLDYFKKNFKAINNLEKLSTIYDNVIRQSRPKTDVLTTFIESYYEFEGKRILDCSGLKKCYPMGKLNPEQAHILQEKYLAPMHRLYDFHRNNPDTNAIKEYAKANKVDIQNLHIFLVKECVDGSVEKEFQDLVKENFPDAQETLSPYYSYVKKVHWGTNQIKEFP